MTRIFSAGGRVSAFLQFEATLATAQAELGMIPEESAAEITRICEEEPTDPWAILEAGWHSGTPVVALLDWMRPQLSEAAGDALHRGTTTQDVIDTATILQMKHGLGELASGLAAVSTSLSRLADEHRHTPILGRTLLQDALVTSFGVTAAQWLAPLIRHRWQISELTTDLPLQLGGPVGDGASFEGRAAELASSVARGLGLAVPATAWHTDRTPVTEALALVGRVAASMAKVGSDVILLSQPAIGELRPPPGRSSSMPHKANPVAAVRAVAAAQVCQTAVAGVITAPPHELERAAGAWQAEWELVPQAFQAAGAAVEAIADCLEGLEVAVDRMAANSGGGPAPDPVVVDRVLGELTALEAE